MREPTCESAFRRMLKAGPVSRLFDKHLFPTPEELNKKYQVTNEQNGKVIDLPHPVSALRVFDNGSYREIDPTLDGAPRGSEATATYFQELINQLKSDMGADYVEEMMSSK